MPFRCSNVQFCQDGDTLFMAGGFGPQQVTDKQSNYTAPYFMAISVSGMIAQVAAGASGNAASAVLSYINNPYVQVTGGEMVRDNGRFYIMFGQNYAGAYQPGLTGTYTSAIRSFMFSAGAISDTFSVFDPLLRRRDITVARVNRQQGALYAGFGGVFDANDNGYLNPVLMELDGRNTRVWMDTVQQLSNNYDCAHLGVYDAASDAHSTLLLGGIGAWQYNTNSGKWVYGDNGAKLPFVRSITRMQFQQGQFTQFMQVPPDAPQMPALLGANAIFVAENDLLFDAHSLDYTKLKTGTRLGWMFGGILSQKPTSSSIYPTSVNRNWYEVYIAIP
jgi:hypothetical protein